MAKSEEVQKDLYAKSKSKEELIEELEREIFGPLKEDRHEDRWKLWKEFGKAILCFLVVLGLFWVLCNYFLPWRDWKTSHNLFFMAVLFAPAFLITFGKLSNVIIDLFTGTASLRLVEPGYVGWEDDPSPDELRRRRKDIAKTVGSLLLYYFILSSLFLLLIKNAFVRWYSGYEFDTAQMVFVAMLLVYLPRVLQLTGGQKKSGRMFISIFTPLLVIAAPTILLAPRAFELWTLDEVLLCLAFSAFIIPFGDLTASAFRSLRLLNLELSVNNIATFPLEDSISRKRDAFDLERLFAVWRAAKEKGRENDARLARNAVVHAYRLASKGDVKLQGKLSNTIKVFESGQRSLSPLPEILMHFLLKSGDGRVRWQAADALGKIGTEKTIEPLILALKDDESDVRESAATALGKIGTEKAIDHLILALKDDDSNVRGRAAEALGKIGTEKAIDPLILALKDDDRGVRRRAASALGNIGTKKAIEPFILALKDDDRGVRRRAASALERIGTEKAIEPFILALKDDDPGVRRRAASALGNIGTEKAIEPLILALKDDSDVRGRAAEALGNIGTEKAIEPLILALKDEYSSVRGRAAEALGNIGSDKAIKPLILALKDEHSSVRGSAASALGNIGTEKAIEPLILALKDDDHGVRRRAASALGEIGDSRAVEALEKILKDKSIFVRMAAAKALKKIE